MVIRSRSNSRVSRSWMISRWSSPRNPQRKPKPSAALVSISKLKLASLSRSFWIESRSFSKSFASTGNSPQNTTGCTSLKPGSALAAGFLTVVMVSPTRVSLISLICAVMKPISPGPSSSSTRRGDPVDQVLVPPCTRSLGRCCARSRRTATRRGRDRTTVDQHGLRRVAVALRRRDPGDDRFEHLVDADPGLGAGQHRIVRRQADDVLDLLPDLVDVGGGQVDLVDHRHDLMVVLDRLIDIGERLRLDALRRVDHQQRLARAKLRSLPSQPPCPGVSIRLRCRSRRLAR